MKRRKRYIFRKLFLFVLCLLLAAGSYYLWQVKKQVTEVKRWEANVLEATTEYDIVVYKDVVLAIILTETKGDHIDLMQSSEIKYGETNQITNSKESIDSGVEHLAEVIKESLNQKTDVWTAVQAYNFGLNYINYTSSHGGKNSVELAESYSKNVLAPALGNSEGKQYRYLTPRALKYNRGHLYQNGGNFFYAEIVRWNLKVIQFVDKLPF